MYVTSKLVLFPFPHRMSQDENEGGLIGFTALFNRIAPDLISRKMKLRDWVKTMTNKYYEVMKEDKAVSIECLVIGKKRGRPMTSNPTASTLRVREYRKRQKMLQST